MAVTNSMPPQPELARLLEQYNTEDKMLDRIAELEAAVREMHKSVPGGTHCDPQEVADTLREIAEKVGVKIID